MLACPGLRIGYVLADDVDRFRRRQPEWSVNGLAAAALPDLLERVDLEGWAGRVSAWRADLVALLGKHGLEPEPSDANFLLVRAPGLRTRLGRQGVLVRDCTSFGLPDHVRIAVPDERGLTRLEEVLCAAR